MEVFVSWISFLASLYSYGHLFQQAVKIVNNIEQRLKGQTGKTLPLSVKGQVHALIKVSILSFHNPCTHR